MSTTPSTGIEEFPDEPETLSFAEIYENLLATEELILTIAPDQEDSLRRGLASVKHKQNKKFEDQGLPVERQNLRFQVRPSTKVEGAIDVQISLNKKAGISVLAMQLPDNEL